MAGNLPGFGVPELDFSSLFNPINAAINRYRTGQRLEDLDINDPASVDTAINNLMRGTPEDQKLAKILNDMSQGRQKTAGADEADETIYRGLATGQGQRTQPSSPVFSPGLHPDELPPAATPGPQSARPMTEVSAAARAARSPMTAPEDFGDSVLPAPPPRPPVQQADPIIQAQAAQAPTTAPTAPPPTVPRPPPQRPAELPPSLSQPRQRDVGGGDAQALPQPQVVPRGAPGVGAPPPPPDARNAAELERLYRLQSQTDRARPGAQRAIQQRIKTLEDEMKAEREEMSKRRGYLIEGEIKEVNKVRDEISDDRKKAIKEQYNYKQLDSILDKAMTGPGMETATWVGAAAVTAMDLMKSWGYDITDFGLAVRARDVVQANQLFKGKVAEALIDKAGRLGANSFSNADRETYASSLGTMSNTVEANRALIRMHAKSAQAVERVGQAVENYVRKRFEAGQIPTRGDIDDLRSKWGRYELDKLEEGFREEVKKGGGRWIETRPDKPGYQPPGAMPPRTQAPTQAPGTAPSTPFRSQAAPVAPPPFARTGPNRETVTPYPQPRDLTPGDEGRRLRGPDGTTDWILQNGVPVKVDPQGRVIRGGT